MLSSWRDDTRVFWMVGKGILMITITLAIVAILLIVLAYKYKGLFAFALGGSWAYFLTHFDKFLDNGYSLSGDFYFYGICVLVNLICMVWFREAEMG